MKSIYELTLNGNVREVELPLNLNDFNELATVLQADFIKDEFSFKYVSGIEVITGDFYEVNGLLSIIADYETEDEGIIAASVRHYDKKKKQGYNYMLHHNIQDLDALFEQLYQRYNKDVPHANISFREYQEFYLKKENFIRSCTGVWIQEYC